MANKTIEEETVQDELCDENEWMEIEGESKADAVERACNALNTSEAYLDIEIVGDHDRTIRARKRSSPKGSVQSHTSHLEQQPAQDFGEEAQELLAGMLKFILEDAQVEYQEKPDELRLEIKGTNLGVIIGKRGQTLEALQHLLVKMLNLEMYQSKRLIIDSEQYRARREESLEHLAQGIAKRVARDRRPFTIEPMNAADRRVIHHALQDHSEVTTKSIGSGEDRRVIVIPKKNNEAGRKKGNYSRPYSNPNSSPNNSSQGQENVRSNQDHQDAKGSFKSTSRRSRPDKPSHSHNRSFASNKHVRLHDSFDVPPVPDVSVRPEDFDVYEEEQVQNNIYETESDDIQEGEE